MRFLCLVLFVQAVAASSITKVCHIPNLSFVSDRMGGPNIRELVGTIVLSDQSSHLHYKCGENWKKTRCKNGEWVPLIRNRCIEKTCSYNGKTFNETQRVNITCEFPQVDLTAECTGKGYWWPNLCGKDVYQNYTEGKVDIQPVSLHNKIQGIMHCKKGYWIYSIFYSKQYISYEYDDRFESENAMFAGVKMKKDSNFTHPVQYLECKDINECQLLKRLKKLQEKCDEMEASGSNNQEINDDSEPENIPECQEADNFKSYLQARDINECTSGKCRNLDGGYDCRCESYEDKINGTCVTLTCESPGSITNGRVLVTEDKLYMYLSCNNTDIYQLKPDRSRFYCSHGVWKSDKTPLDTLPECIISDRICGIPTVPLNGKIFGNEPYKEGDVINYQCKSGYRLKGPYERVCKNGIWSDYQPICADQRELLSSVRQLRIKHIDDIENMNQPQYHKDRVRVTKSGIAMCMLIDTSASMRDQETLDEVLCLLHLVAAELLDSDKKEYVKIGIVSFGKEVEVVLKINSTDQGNLEKVAEKIHSVRYSAGGSPIENGIDHCLKELHDIQEQPVVMLLTDGHINVDEDVDSALKGFRNVISLIAIGVGRDVNTRRLQEMVSLLNGAQFFNLNEFPNLNDLVTKLVQTKAIEEVCGVSGFDMMNEEEFGMNKYQSSARKDTPEGSWPWLVAIFYQGDLIGSGTLICSNWVLTSKKVIEGFNKDEISVVAGLHYVTDQPPQNARTVQVRQIKVNEEIALLQTDAPFPMNAYIRTACLPTKDVSDSFFNIDPSSFDGIFVGYGGSPLVKTSLNAVYRSCQNYTFPKIEEEDAGNYSKYLCVSGESTKINPEDGGGSLMFTKTDTHGTNRHITVAIAEKHQKGQQPTFIRLRGMAEWIHNETENCNAEYHEKKVQQQAECLNKFS